MIWSGLVILVAFGVALTLTRLIVIADVARPVTRARVEAAGKLFPQIAGEISQMEQHFSGRPELVSFHVITGAAFLILGLLQFSASIRKRSLRFHRRSGYVLVALALAAGSTGVWQGVVDPFSSTERLPSAVAGAMFVIFPLIAILAVRRGQVSRHREWMIRFFATGVGIVVIRLVDPVIIWLTIPPATFREMIGVTFWAGWLVALTVAEVWIRFTRTEQPMKLTAVTQT